MQTITFSDARAKLATTMEHVCLDHAPVVVTRQKMPSVVMISLEDYEALEETAYLMRSPKNAERLTKAIRSLSAGKGKARKLAEA